MFSGAIGTLRFSSSAPTVAGTVTVPGVVADSVPAAARCDDFNSANDALRIAHARRASQLRRAIGSVALNLAEGVGCIGDSARSLVCPSLDFVPRRIRNRHPRCRSRHDAQSGQVQAVPALRVDDQRWLVHEVGVA
jgi:hypothetical protein